MSQARKIPQNPKATTRLPVGNHPTPERSLKGRAGRILKRLYETYPDAHCALHYRTPLDLYVATVLSAQCTDERVNKVTPGLFRDCRRPEDYLSLGTEGLEKRIRSTGFYRAKTRNILGGCHKILEDFGGRLPRSMAELITIPGCGRKTANVILGNAYGITGITVDTHVGRITRRLGLTDLKDPVKVEGALQRLFPEAEWTQLSHTIIFHGRTICDARKPLCGECPVRRMCPSADQV